MHEASATVVLNPPPAVSGAGTPGIAACYHCGQPNLHPERWQTVQNGARRAFCCAGCLGIAQTIHVAGLDAFYDRRTEVASAPVDEPGIADSWSQWDDPAQAARFMHAAPDGSREVSLLVEGIHCGACVWLIERWLARRPGISLAEVNFATRRARVVLDPAQARLSDVLRAIAAIGYRAYPYDPARREALMRRESRALLLRTAIALLAMMQVMMFALPTYVTVEGVESEQRLLLEWASLTLTLPALLYCAAPFFRGAWRDFRMRRLGMDVPVALGLGAAFIASAASTVAGAGAVYYDSVTMFIALLLVARYVELAARRRAGDAVEAVARARPATAERLVDWPSRRDVEPTGAATLAEGDFILVRPGATVPADGTIVEGCANVEAAILTGESQPSRRSPGEPVLAGSIVRDDALVVRVSVAGDGTLLAAIERLVARAAAARPRVARVADRVAGWFVGALLGLAAMTAVAWSIHDPSRVFAVTFAVLVVSCPCALSLATPAALAAANGALARRRVVVTRADALEALSRVTNVVFDKTGTLTPGRAVLLDVHPLRGGARDDAVALAVGLEATSEHPLAAAFRAAGEGLDWPRADALHIVAGHGVEGVVAGRVVRLGRPEFVGALAGPLPDEAMRVDPSATLVALGDSFGFIALFAVGDAARPGARALVSRLKALHIVPSILSGDRPSVAAVVAAQLGIADARGDATPEDKRAAIVALQAGGAIVAMIGDGINDAPSLAQAQVSVSLGSATPLAQWTADVVVLADDLGLVADAIGHARRTFRIVRQNLGWAFGYNAIAIPAAAFGFVTPLAAAVGMSLSSLVVVGNAMRLARLDGGPQRGPEWKSSSC
ncbi:MAG: heavy metal translocating P-type ATPase [Casimicrobiaceae bacterium]